MWNYAEMAQIAKQCGGPELFMKGLVETGKSQMEPVIYAAGGVGVLLGLTVGMAGCLLIKKRMDAQKKLNNIQYEVLEQMAEVEKELCRRVAILESYSDNNSLQKRIVNVDISSLQPREDNIKQANDKELKVMAEEYKKHGIMEPIMVYDRKSHYEIIAGTRRWRAAQIAGLSQVPIVVFEDKKVLSVNS